MDMAGSDNVNWTLIREGARRYHTQAFLFVQDGLSHTSAQLHRVGSEHHNEPGLSSDTPVVPAKPADNLSASFGSGPGMGPDLPPAARGEELHVSGRDLCLGLRSLAIERYGSLAPVVLGKWGIRKTDDFGIIVFALIEKGILSASPTDRLSDFASVYDFEEAFEGAAFA